MPVVTRRELLEAGVHFGHQTRRWNPKMGRFLYGERSGIYIIDLEKTLTGLEEAHAFARNLGRRGGIVLFVGTKKQAQEVISDNATRVGMPYVTTRWLGGMLTNFQTVSRRLIRLRELREMERTGAFDYLPKKEAIRLRHEADKLERNLGGMQALDRLPDAIFVIDTKKEHIAVNEARKLSMPVIAIVDTNCDPDEVDYVIPGNDDAIRSVSLVTRIIADALVEGRQEGREAMVTRATGPEIEPEPEPVAAPPAPTPEPAVQAPTPEPAVQAPTPEPVVEVPAPVEPSPAPPEAIPPVEAEALIPEADAAPGTAADFAGAGAEPPATASDVRQEES